MGGLSETEGGFQVREMKTAVQITMFRTINQGSALQTYALHTKLQELGYRCLTIDYPRQMGRFLEKRTVRTFLLKLWNALLYWRRNRHYARFLREELNLTREYWAPEALANDPPVADLYVTGSDQTFNSSIPSWDPSYMLSFVPRDRRATVRKIAYASSFATESIPERWKDAVPALLKDYDAISTREANGVEIVRKLTGRCDAMWCCDPTILLNRDEWRVFAAKARRRIRGKYILVYLLTYAVDPYPAADRLIAEAQMATGYEVIYLLGRKKDMFRPHSRIVKNADTYEFVDLFLNASLIITSSFHGAAFSIQSGNPFMAMVHGDARTDDRVRSLLERVGAEKNAIDVPIADSIHFDSLEKWRQPDGVVGRLEQFRQESFAWLKEKGS